MRFAAALSLASFLALAAGAPASADQPDPGRQTPAAGAPAATPAPEAPVDPAKRLDELFKTLKSSKDETAAKQAESEIISLWMQSGSDTVDLLMSWSVKAIEDKKYPLALDLLDRITILEPDYVEGWNKRATVYFLLDDYSKSIVDIQKTLSLEPRHFGALSGLGTIFRELGQERRAVEAYKTALTLDPHLDNVKKALDEIEKDSGDDI